jgi:hypothetical protein
LISQRFGAALSPSRGDTATDAERLLFPHRPLLTPSFEDATTPDFVIHHLRFGYQRFELNNDLSSRSRSIPFTGALPKLRIESENAGEPEG